MKPRLVLTGRYYHESWLGGIFHDAGIYCISEHTYAWKIGDICYVLRERNYPVDSSARLE
jgi:hypothetical protein